MSESKGVIYILTNPSFPEYVKIGYADDIKQRLAQLNRSECTPFAFRVFATYEVDIRLTDMKLHNIIDRLNPNLRAIDNVDGKKRVREFYAMTAEDAYALFEAIAEINGTTDKLKLMTPTKAQQQDEIVAEEVKVAAREKATPFSFDMCDIPIGAVIEFCCKDNEHNGETCVVVSGKMVEYQGKKWSLSGLATELTKSKWSVAGPRYFKYNGEWLNTIRERIGF